MPPGFSWVDKPHVAALAMPESAEDLSWLRRNGVEVLISLTEDPPFRRWINEAGLLSVHVPIPDMTAPSIRQFDLCIDTINRAKKTGMGVAVHCAAGKGRTGTMLAAYFVSLGMTPRQAIERVRELRPGSVETLEQEQAIADFAESKVGKA